MPWTNCCGRRSTISPLQAMPKPEFVLPLNCPECPHELFHVTSSASLPNGELDIHIYRCPQHGLWKVLPSGGMVPHLFTN